MQFVIFLMLVLVGVVQGKVRLEESKFWPVRQRELVKEEDRVTAFKKLNIGLGIMRICPEFMIRYRD
jgi:hypothetical protein